MSWSDTTKRSTKKVKGSRTPATMCLECSSVPLKILVLSLWFIDRCEGVPNPIAPEIFPPSTEHVIWEGESWKIRCEAHEPLIWAPPNDLSDKTSKFRVTTYNEQGNTLPITFVSYLTIQNAIYLDTGSYFCHLASSKAGDIERTSAHTYLFVKSNHTLFDDSSRMLTLNVQEYSETTTPCRPTDPEVTMTIELDGSDITQNLESMQMSYEPQKGLMINEAHLKLHNRALTCVAQNRYGHQETMQIFLSVQQVDILLPPMLKPMITNQAFVFIGSKFILKCYSPMPPHHVPIELNFHIPHKFGLKDFRKGSKHVTISNQTINRDRKALEVLVTKTLTIDSVGLEDEGVYSCSANYGDKQSNYTSYKLSNVRNKEHEFIGSPIFHGNSTISVLKPMRVMWIFTIDAHPQPRFTWIHPTGQEIHPTVLEKYELEINDTSHVIKAIINQVGLNDTGEYQIIIDVGEEYNNHKYQEGSLRKVIPLQLRYITSPLVRFQEEPTRIFYPEGQVYNISCSIAGYPIKNDSIKWTFQECTAFDSCGPLKDAHSRANHIEEVDKNTIGNIHYHYKSTLEIQAIQSGRFKCEACTRIDPWTNSPSQCNSSLKDFFILEFPEVFFTRVQGEISVEHDQVTLFCAASKYQYQNISWFRKGTPSAPSDEWTHCLTAISEATPLSINATLVFRDIRLSDSGEYKCRAEGRDQAIKEHHTALIVHPVKKPEPEGANSMNGSLIEVQERESLKLNCQVSGRPVPEVTWTKDDTPMEQTNKNDSSIEFINDGMVLHIKSAAETESGHYQCFATNRGGTHVGSLELNVLRPSGMSTVIIVVVGLVGLFLLAIIVVLFWKVKIYTKRFKELSKADIKLFQEGDPKSINPELGVEEQADLLPYDFSYEFPRGKLNLLEQIGSGAFGRVVKAQAYGIVPWESCTTVAVKRIKSHADISHLQALMAELKIMIHLGRHLNVLNLLGACTSLLHKRELLMIVEYCRFGSLEKYILSHRRQFINQMINGEVNFHVGQEVIDQHGSNLARAREEDEISASYHLRPTMSEVSSSGGFPSQITMTTNGDKQGQLTASDRTHSRRSPQPSVRYVNAPHRAQLARKQSVQSDYYDGLDQQVGTDMTTVTGGESSPNNIGNQSAKGYLSLASQEGPTNMKRDPESQHKIPISTKDLICWAFQVSRGMDYLGRQKVLHGDLACRNILLATDNIVKICDFGLAKDIYRNNNYMKSSEGRLPIKWLAVESLRDNVFSTQSDVWSFGIVLWEMFSLGRTPYPGIEGDETFLDKILGGYRMACPDYCPANIFNWMSQCWDKDPLKRPSFALLMNGLSQLLEPGDRNSYFQLAQSFDREMSRGQGLTENPSYLDMMCSPNFKYQMPMEDICLQHSEEGYLIPTLSPNSDTEAPNGVIEADESGYLLPNNDQFKPNEVPSTN